MDFSGVIDKERDDLRYIIILTAALMLAACGTEENSTTDSNQENTASVMFQNIDVKVDGDEFILSGEAITIGDEVFYVINQGEERLQEEKNIMIDSATAGDWKVFEINEAIPETAKDSEDPLIVMLYGKDENNEKINPNYIPVDLGD